MKKSKHTIFDLFGERFTRRDYGIEDGDSIDVVERAWAETIALNVHSGKNVVMSLTIPKEQAQRLRELLPKSPQPSPKERALDILRDLYTDLYTDPSNNNPQTAVAKRAEYSNLFTRIHTELSV